MKTNVYLIDDFSEYDKPGPSTSKVKPGPRTSQVKSGDQVVDLFISEGERSNTLMSLGGTMIARGMSSKSVAAALNVENRSRCQPPLTDDEVGSIVKNLTRYKQKHNNNLQQCGNHAENINHLPIVQLFGAGSSTRISDTAAQFGEIYSEKQKIFRRVHGGGSGHSDQIQVISDDNTLKALIPAKASSEFEDVAIIKLRKKGNDIDAIIREHDAKLILESERFIEQLPPIRTITNCPVMIESPTGETIIINSYDRESGVFARGQMPPNIDVVEATEILLSVIEEFSFKTLADRSRCLSLLITPALVMGAMGKLRSPIHFIEADASQSGKGYFTRITAAIYGDTPYIINQQHGGVGSLEESFNQALGEGRRFINLDNLTAGRNAVFNSEKICSFMTEDTYSARYLRRCVTIDPRPHVIQITTNGCALSTDLMNRSCPVSIQKRMGHRFKKYPEGSILDHIRKSPVRYQSAIFSIINAWCKAGKPRTDTTAHESSFTPWAQSLDWIVQNLLGQPPLLEGYEQTRDRITSPDLQRIRDIALAILKINSAGQWLTATEVLDTVAYQGIQLPGLDASCDYHESPESVKENAKIQLGASLARGFKYSGGEDAISLEGIRVERKEEPKTYDSGAVKYIKYYRFTENP